MLVGNVAGGYSATIIYRITVKYLMPVWATWLAFDVFNIDAALMWRAVIYAMMHLCLRQVFHV